MNNKVGDKRLTTEDAAQLPPPGIRYRFAEPSSIPPGIPSRFAERLSLPRARQALGADPSSAAQLSHVRHTKAASGT